MDGDRFFWAVFPKDGNDYKDPPTSNMDDSDHHTYGQLTLLKLFYVNLLNSGNSETKMLFEPYSKKKKNRNLGRQTSITKFVTLLPPP